MDTEIVRLRLVEGNGRGTTMLDADLKPPPACVATCDRARPARASQKKSLMVSEY